MRKIAIREYERAGGLWQSRSMDSLAYAKAHEHEWARLEYLARQHKLSGKESDELIQLYQRVTGQLAKVRTHAPDPDVVLRLSAALGSARSRITARAVSPWKAILDFFVVTLPLSFYRIRMWILACIGLNIALAAIVFAMYVFSPGLIDTLAPYSAQEAYAKQTFEAYYSEYSHSDFSVLVWSNNAWIAVQCVAGGITGAWPIYVLYSNSVMLGQTAAIMERFDELSLFFQLILPHGQLELTAIFVAGAAGMKIFWTFVHPGDVPRIRALGLEGRHTIMTSIGLVFVLLLSGFLEGFVTPSVLPWWLKILLGTLATAAFWAWMLYFGKHAVQRGLDKENPRETGWHIEYA